MGLTMPDENFKLRIQEVEMYEIKGSMEELLEISRKIYQAKYRKYTYDSPLVANLARGLNYQVLNLKLRTTSKITFIEPKDINDTKQFCDELLAGISNKKKRRIPLAYEAMNNGIDQHDSSSEICDLILWLNTFSKKAHYNLYTQHRHDILDIWFHEESEAMHFKLMWT